jgi:hypothetical protein
MLESPNFANRNRVSSRQQNLHHDSKVEAKASWGVVAADTNKCYLAPVSH